MRIIHLHNKKTSNKKNMKEKFQKEQKNNYNFSMHNLNLLCKRIKLLSIKEFN